MKLNILGLPKVQTLDDFSKLTHISKYTLYQLSKHSDKYYKTYTIPKKTGGKRLIAQPSKKLKGLQGWILVNILNKLKVSNSCKGFEKGSSTANNVEPHKNANCILVVDLSDFFGHVNSNKVYNIFRTIGYNCLISTIFTNICTYKKTLPQGSPCSPKLANLASWKLDLRIQGYVGKKGIIYTRYADDLTFSGLNPVKISKILPFIKKIIEDENFKINEKKVRFSGPSRAKIVTGLVIANDSFGIGKKKYKILRAKIHHLTLPYEQNNLKLLNEVKGWLSYLNSVDRMRYISAKEYIGKLKEKYPNTLIKVL